MRDENDFRTDHKDTEEILKLEKEIFQYQKANARLQTGLYERSFLQRFGPYLFLLAWFLLLEFMKNWMGYYVEISSAAFVPIVILLIVFIIMEYRRDRKRQEIMEQIRQNRRKCDRLQEEIAEIRKGM